MRKRRQDATESAVAVPRVFAAACVALVTFAAYALTVAPDVYSLDSPELATAAYTLGIAHEPGYPLYTVTGWLFSHAFPVGNVAFRLNLLSAVFASAAVGLTFLTAMRLTQRTLLAAAGALALGFSYWFWSDSLAAEVYTLDVALFAGMLLAAVEWRERRRADRPTLAVAAAVGLLLGLGMATRTTAMLYVPAVVAFAWVSGERSPRGYAMAGAGMLAGLAFYAYLPLRSALGSPMGPGEYGLDGSLQVRDLATWGGFWSHISASAFRGEAFAYGPLAALREAGVYFGRLAGSFLGIGLVLGAAGGVWLWQRDRGLLLLLAGTALPATVFFINYGAIDKEFMFLPSYAVWALLMVVGIDRAIEAGTASSPAWGRSALVAGAALALPAAAFAVNLPLVSLRNETSVRDASEAFLLGAPEGAIVYGSFLEVAPLQYLQEVEGVRRDVKLVNAWTVDAGFVSELAAANVGVRPLLVMDVERSLGSEYVLVPRGEGFEVRRR